MTNRLLTAAACALLAGTVSAQSRFQTDILRDTFGYDARSKATVSLDKLAQGCPVRDCIPSIDDPEFLAAGDVDFLRPDDLVLGVEIDGDTRAYPTRILNRHEIVNDRFGDRAIAVTYCPLCGSGVAFERRVGGDVVELGVSGLLHNNDLVMYDRKTETLWQQITGEAIVGPRVGEELNKVAVTMAPWNRWREAHPDTRVLAPVAAIASYSRNPYGNYSDTDDLYFPVNGLDSRLSPKTVVHGAELGGQSVAITDDAIGESGRSFKLDGVEYRAERDRDGGVRFVTSGGNVTPAIRLYWFAWYNFHPATALIRS